MLRVIMCSLRQKARRATASIKKPIHNVKECGQIPRNRPLQAGTVSLHLWSTLTERLMRKTILKPQRGEDGGAYRDRTDDLMLAKQPLSQLS